MRCTLSLRPDDDPRSYAVLDRTPRDLGEALDPTPAGVLLTGAEHGRDVVRLGALLAVHEAETGLTHGTLRIVPVLTTARGVLQAASFAEAGPRLAALGLDAAALDQVLGPAERAGARTMLALAAAAAGVPLVALVSDAAGALRGA
ncbi:hypothetical protein [Methylobacterium radiodurans]|uniref:Uncharacterized protein n=1 Tax=Methylobacterium radiodurans TaxID=2202828 RepID=A0A2U8VWR6_9HYPH|nr:hypothetical protein [Methylobacterium radiodurans]AWN38205.1 hypothetical protein DK427_22725 [Methylobacterium radiodurans]